jgi:hypothetical protein
MRFHPLALVLSFCVGMVFMILHVPRPKVVVKFPSPGVPSDLYHTGAGTCYRVRSEHVTCPSDRKNVLPQPVTEADASDSVMRFFN